MNRWSGLAGRVQRAYAWGPDGQIHYRRAGPTGARSPLLLLHGLPGSGGLFEDFIGELGRTRSVIAPDLPGHGMSDALKRRGDIGPYASAMIELVADLGLGVVDVMGVAEGGAVALEMARQESDVVRKIVLIAAPAPQGLLSQPILSLDGPGFPETGAADILAAASAFLDS